MAGGIVHTSSGKRYRVYNGRLTWRVILACVVAASGGLLFGFDIGISGGVVSFPSFQRKFFPSVYEHSSSASSSPYCKYNNQVLQLFTSSMYLAGMVGGLAGGYTTRRLGRTGTMVLSGLCYMAGAGLMAGAVNVAMLVIGRIALGFGTGLANQAVPLYLSEMAPAKLRGALNNLFQVATCSGILGAEFVNYGTQHLGDWGWRLSLGLAAGPAAVLFLGGLGLPETPNSLVERGHVAKARQVLEAIRGVRDVDAEMDDIKTASAVAARVKHPWRNLLSRRYRPELVMAIMIPSLQQITGINSVMFYAPEIFQSIGLSNHLLASAATGMVILGATFVSVVTVDFFGRKVLLIQGGLQMIVAEVVVAILLALKFGGSNGDAMPREYGVAVVVVVCVFVAGFGWSWGPLGWLIPSEIQPLETRSAGQGLTVCMNFLFTFLVGQCFLSMLCGMQYGIFLFFAAWVVFMTLFVIFLLPETKNIPIEEMQQVWSKHWLWKRCVPALPEDMSVSDVIAHSKGVLPTDGDAAPQPAANLSFKVNRASLSTEAPVDGKGAV